jgi:hypothetical protein
MAGAVAHGHDVGDRHISGGWGNVKSSPAKVPARGGAAATKGAAREVVVALGLAVSGGAVLVAMLGGCNF